MKGKVPEANANFQKVQGNGPTTVSVTNKDTYMSIAHMAEDREVLLMLSTNRYFNDPRFFKEILERRYPLLIPFRKEGEDWKSLYVRMIKYIALLKEEYGVDYIPSKTFNPKRIYYNLKNWNETFFDDNFEAHIRDVSAYFVGESGNVKSIDNYLKDYENDSGVCSNLLQGIIAYGNETLLNKYLKVICVEDRQGFEDGEYIDFLIATGIPSFVELAIDQIKSNDFWDENTPMVIRLNLLDSGNLELVKNFQQVKQRVYIDEFGPGSLVEISCFSLNDVMNSGSFEVFQYTLDNLCSESFKYVTNNWDYKFIAEERLEWVKYFIETYQKAPEYNPDKFPILIDNMMKTAQIYHADDIIRYLNRF